MRWFKCNTNAGFHGDSNHTSVVWILRDHMGRLVIEGTNWNYRKCSIIEREAMALLETMKEMEHRGITHVIFELDLKKTLFTTYAWVPRSLVPSFVTLGMHYL
jgi:hypothetical protein